MLNGFVWKDTDGKMLQAHGGGILYEKGIYYWYGECYEKICGTYHNCGVNCYSSTDLINWKNEGRVLKMFMEREWCEHDLYFGNILQRPKVVRNRVTGKYFMYFHLDNPEYTKSMVGIAECGTPNGEFIYIGGIRPHFRPSHDLTVFDDDDGSIYLINASDHNSITRAIMISEDGLHFGTYSVITMEVPGFATREAPAVFKRDSRYYMISSGCSGWKPNTAECHVSDSMLGKWRSIGNPCVGEGSELTFESQSTFVLKVNDNYIYMGDRWKPKTLDESGYVWLPIEFDKDGAPVIKWRDEWKGVYVDA